MSARDEGDLDDGGGDGDHCTHGVSFEDECELCDDEERQADEERDEDEDDSEDDEEAA